MLLKIKPSIIKTPGELISLLERKKVVIFDGDGVLYKGNKVMHSFLKIYNDLKGMGIKTILMTNNSTKTPMMYLEKTRQMGYSFQLDEIMTSAIATANYLAKNGVLKNEKIYVIGMTGLITALKEKEFNVDTSEKIELEWEKSFSHVVVGMDIRFNYLKLKKAIWLILNGAGFLGTNPDPLFVGDGILSPGTGSLLAAIERSTGVSPTIIGKPERYIYEETLKKLSCDPSETFMIGDSLITDILGARRMGIESALVLGGFSKEKDMEKLGIYPDHVLTF